MATANPAKTLQDDATCSICLDYFQDPVMIIECGHNFCRACITKYWKASDCSACCPECRQLFSWKNLKPNRQLGNMVETAKQLNLQLKNSSEKERMCEEHQKPLTVFCKTDQTLICTVCDRSKAHRNHEVVHTPEASAHYKEMLLRHLENLKKERNKIQSAKSNGEKPCQELLKETQVKRQEIVSEFQRQHQFLEEQEQLQLSKLRDLEKEIERKRDNYASKFVDEISYITDLIGDLEKKDKQPTNEFLQNIGSVLDRCKKGTFQYPAIPDASDMKKRFYQFCEGSTFLQSSLRKFRDNLLKPKWIKENVLFDPETAHPRYVVSADRKTVRWGSIRQEFPYNPKRFHYVRCVLGCKGFTSGKHYWTVDVGDGDYWAVGVARESVEREEEIEFEPDEGIWALGLYNDQYKALTSPPTLLDVEDEPTQIQISLNYEAGTVAFYDTEDNTRLFTFQSVDFEGEEIFPFFRIVDSSTVLKLCS
ncbi:E3 ubiquitin-protein ligase TRIM39-like isoform X1 [Eublepharis macularius]|uniref:E3 ubiquitin-protein ligase TRIM39-like isoform X1 n=1 Tax=Eublepharis macularius TaxID=481883 RepID=A0AA97JA65_EUBMA|nr:E3 ubiquitin-protein ligase TRIM39-like isoform X1 [Eublepharis macularius]